jgi:hypothetical protein
MTLPGFSNRFGLSRWGSIGVSQKWILPSNRVQRTARATVVPALLALKPVRTLIDAYPSER